jgi:hypothetical protein
MVSINHVSTLIHEIHELNHAIERFSNDADGRSKNVPFDLQAIIQWGHELASLIRDLEEEPLPERTTPLHRAIDPLYERTLKDARAIHDDAQSVDRELVICLDAISAIDDGPALWAGLFHLRSELETLEDILTRFSKDLNASVEYPTDS